MRELRNLSKVPGWFNSIDQQVFDLLLTLQTKQGNLLEIGTYLGKSAIYLGMYLRNSETLHVCDIFDLPPTDEKNLEEVLNSYDSLSLAMFKKNYLGFHKSLPEIHVCDSANLGEKVSALKFRFIHIDGSHLYPTVNQDIEFALSHIDGSDGIIVLDDYRASHTPAVANAMWEKVSNGLMRVLILTENKAYLAPVTSKISLTELSKRLLLKKINFTLMTVKTGSFIRILPEANKPLRNSKQLVRYLVPPIFFSLVSRFR